MQEACDASVEKLCDKEVVKVRDGWVVDKLLAKDLVNDFGVPRQRAQMRVDDS